MILRFIATSTITGEFCAVYALCLADARSTVGRLRPRWAHVSFTDGVPL